MQSVREGGGGARYIQGTCSYNCLCYVYMTSATLQIQHCVYARMCADLYHQMPILGAGDIIG